jgi:hypothetical protein
MPSAMSDEEEIENLFGRFLENSEPKRIDTIEAWHRGCSFYRLGYCVRSPSNSGNSQNTEELIMEATATVDKRAIDRDVERLVHEIGAVIEKAQPEEREELRQMATDLIQEEVVQTVPDAENNAGAKRPMNLISLGAFVIIIGAGLSILIPPIGLLLVGGGLATLIFGTVYRMATK